MSVLILRNGPSFLTLVYFTEKRELSTVGFRLDGDGRRLLDWPWLFFFLYIYFIFLFPDSYEILLIYPII